MFYSTGVVAPASAGFLAAVEAESIMSNRFNVQCSGVMKSGISLYSTFAVLNFKFKSLEATI